MGELYISQGASLPLTFICERLHCTNLVPWFLCMDGGTLQVMMGDFTSNFYL
jgi:hypothetical protein